MKCQSVFAVALLCLVGCDVTNQVESGPSPLSIVGDQSVDPLTIDTAVSSEIVKDQPEGFVFDLSDAATMQVRAAMAAVPGGTHLVVSVDNPNENVSLPDGVEE